MKQKTLEYLESHQSETPSKWREEAEWRRENKTWLLYSKRIAVMLLSYMKREHLTQSAMAERMDRTIDSPQCLAVGEVSAVPKAL